MDFFVTHYEPLTSQQQQAEMVWVRLLRNFRDELDDFIDAYLASYEQEVAANQAREKRNKNKKNTLPVDGIDKKKLVATIEKSKNQFFKTSEICALFGICETSARKYILTPERAIKHKNLLVISKEGLLQFIAENMHEPFRQVCPQQSL